MDTHLPHLHSRSLSPSLFFSLVVYTRMRACVNIQINKYDVCVCTCIYSMHISPSLCVYILYISVYVLVYIWIHNNVYILHIKRKMYIPIYINCYCIYIYDTSRYIVIYFVSPTTSVSIFLEFSCPVSVSVPCLCLYPCRSFESYCMRTGCKRETEWRKIRQDSLPKSYKP